MTLISQKQNSDQFIHPLCPLLICSDGKIKNTEIELVSRKSSFSFIFYYLTASWNFRPNVTCRTLLWHTEPIIQNRQGAPSTRRWKSEETFYVTVTDKFNPLGNLRLNSWKAFLSAVLKAGPYYVLSGEGNGTPLQYSCLENPMDGGAW